MAGQYIDIPTTDGSNFKAYKEGSGPIILVIQEIFGINGVMRETCTRLASEGFTALCPDLFHQFEPGIELDDHNPEDLKQAFAYFAHFNIDHGLRDIAATLAHSRTLQAGKVGAMGFCLGGYLAYRTATDTDCDAVVGFYGVGIENMLTKAEAIRHPLMLHTAGQDEYVPHEAQSKIHRVLDTHDFVTLYDYPERDHAFARPDGAHFHQDDAKTAYQRSFDFFRTHLGA
ncbi:dienelactone hydrolase family protein [Woodsholea maritima]|uniref:dienelactone hydrolase family protein n=1 Tax=Woodsholea maritima TaxID=240237 RepID=UPI00036F3CC8|nr:dienelactone hydrolase family protein [Woodsholea maritima]